MLPLASKSVKPQSQHGWGWSGGSHAGRDLASAGSDQGERDPAAAPSSECSDWWPGGLTTLWRRAEASTPDLGQASASILPAPTRNGPRTADLVLRDSERDYLRRMLSRVSLCERGVMTVGRRIALPHSVSDERLTFRPRCRSRACPPCDEKRRALQERRTEGAWRLFLTVGVPTDKWSTREAWWQISGWATSLMNRIRDYGRRGSGRDVVVCPGARWLHNASVMSADPFERQPSLIRYAWVIEPHKSGRPHLHVVVTCDFVASAWLRKVWGQIVGSPVLWCKIRRVRNVSGISRYMSKYISKSRLPLDILSALDGHRMFACTLPRARTSGDGWRRLDPSPDDLFGGDLLAICPSDGGPAWRISSRSPDRYCSKYRELSYNDVAPYLPDYVVSPLTVSSPDESLESLDPLNVTLSYSLSGQDLSSGLHPGQGIGLLRPPVTNQYTPDPDTTLYRLFPRTEPAARVVRNVLLRMRCWDAWGLTSDRPCAMPTA
jgi:hypothetical protein